MWRGLSAAAARIKGAEMNITAPAQAQVEAHAPIFCTFFNSFASYLYMRSTFPYYMAITINKIICTYPHLVLDYIEVSSL